MKQFDFDGDTYSNVVRNVFRTDKSTKSGYDMNSGNKCIILTEDGWIKLESDSHIKVTAPRNYEENDFQNIK